MVTGTFRGGADESSAAFFTKTNWTVTTEHGPVTTFESNPSVAANCQCATLPEWETTYCFCPDLVHEGTFSGPDNLVVTDLTGWLLNPPNQVPYYRSE